MSDSILIKNAQLVNEGSVTRSDVLIVGDRIAEIASSISLKSSGTRVVDADGLYLMPGMIDDQVHFREPGLTHKATIESESRAAIAGGINSFIEMPNTNPQATTMELVEDKFDMAAEGSWANYSFMLGGTNENIEDLIGADPTKIAGIKLFLGSSTGDMLVDDPKVLEAIFSKTNLVISVHCEDEVIIRANLARYVAQYKDGISMAMHPEIRSEEACYASSSKAVALAKKTGARLHVFHLSTAKETRLFNKNKDVTAKKITAEVCIHHLWFSDQDYDTLGSKIKWNPSVKKASDRLALRQALLEDRIDVIATDHAPHTWEEKTQSYIKAPSGGPMVQHALVALLDLYHQDVISLEKIVEKFAHNPAKLFEIKERGFVREGYKADLVLVDLNAPWTVNKSNILYKCGWSPFEGTVFKSRVTHTFVNGMLTYEGGKFVNRSNGERLTFDR